MQSHGHHITNKDRLWFVSLSQPILISWGADGIAPREVLDLYHDDIPWGPKAIIEIKEGLPKLIDDLNLCLKAWEKKYLNI